MMGNLDIYNAVRKVPENAQKKITGGRLSNMTDINPMWRIKTLTEQFGVCGFGWKTLIVRSWLDGADGNEITANVEILLFIKMNGEWSDGIPGIGGSKFMANERNGMYVSDECYKMAYTDALSVACKALGIGADVYWDKDAESKYRKPERTEAKIVAPKADPKSPIVTKFMQVMELLQTKNNITVEMVGEWIAKRFGRSIPINDLTDEQFAQLMTALSK